MDVVGWCGLGGVAGMWLGLSYLGDLFPPDYVKIFFTSLWMAFGGVLWRLQEFRGRCLPARLGSVGGRETAALLLGVLGGAVTSIVGSGIDILCFSYLTLRLRISEKIATPTSVVLMASNAVAGFAIKGLVLEGMALPAIGYLLVCIPVVVFGAPLGSLFIRGRTRLFVARLLIVSICLQFLWAHFVIPLSARLILFSSLTLLVGALFFWGLHRSGHYRTQLARRAPTY